MMPLIFKFNKNSSSKFKAQVSLAAFALTFFLYATPSPALADGYIDQTTSMPDKVYNFNRYVRPPAAPDASNLYYDVNDTPPPPSRFTPPTSVHTWTFDETPVPRSSPPVANAIMQPSPQAQPVRVVNVYKRPLLSSNVVYCRPVPPATKCDDGGFMGLISGLFGARSTVMSAQPGFPRTTSISDRNVQLGYRPPPVAIAINAQGEAIQ